MTDAMPARANRAYVFIGLNAFSYQIAVTSPMILFARDLGAPSTVIGILTGVLPLLILLQLPMARHFARLGYLELYVRGWIWRIAAVFGMTALPIGVRVGWLSREAAIAALLALVTWFSLMRGLVSGAWMPWLAAIIPPRRRVQFLSLERISTNVAAVLAMLTSAAVLAAVPSLDAYAIVFGVSAAVGVASLHFMRQIPAPPPDRDSRPPGTAAFVRAALRDLSFRRFLALNVAAQLVLGALPAFTVVFTRDELGMGNGLVLFVSAGALVAGIIALQVMRRAIERRGSKPYLWRALAGWAVCLTAWLMVSALARPAGSGGALPTPGLVAVAIALLLANGYVSATFELAAARILVTTAGNRPETAQIFALNTAVANLAAFVSPVAWGALLDASRGVDAAAGALHFTNYSIFFGLMCLFLTAVAWALRRTPEPSA